MTTCIPKSGIISQIGGASSELCQSVIFSWARLFSSATNVTFFSLTALILLWIDFQIGHQRVFDRFLCKAGRRPLVLVLHGKMANANFAFWKSIDYSSLYLSPNLMANCCDMRPQFGNGMVHFFRMLRYAK